MLGQQTHVAGVHLALFQPNHARPASGVCATVAQPTCAMCCRHKCRGDALATASLALHYLACAWPCNSNQVRRARLHPHQHLRPPADAALARVWQLHALVNGRVQNVGVLRPERKHLLLVTTCRARAQGRHAALAGRPHACPRRQRTFLHVTGTSCPPAPRKVTVDSPST